MARETQLSPTVQNEHEEVFLRLKTAVNYLQWKRDFKIAGKCQVLISRLQRHCTSTLSIQNGLYVYGINFTQREYLVEKYQSFKHSTAVAISINKWMLFLVLRHVAKRNLVVNNYDNRAVMSSLFWADCCPWKYYVMENYSALSGKYSFVVSELQPTQRTL